MNPEIAAGHRLMTLMRTLMRQMAPDQDHDPFGNLPLGQLRVVNALGQGPRSASEVATELGLSASSLTQIVQRLVEIDLVQKQDDPDDKRQRLLSLSMKGRSLSTARQEVRAKNAAILLRQIDADDAAHLLTVLERMTGGHGMVGEPRNLAAFLERRAP